MRLLLSVTLVLATTLASCTSEVVVEPPTNSGPPVQLADGTVVATGTFEGRSDHIVTGTAELIEIDGMTAISLGDDFELDGAPAPRVGLGRGGEYLQPIGDLTKHAGSQVYWVGADVDTASFDELYIWCEDFSVPLGVAALDR